MDYIKDLQTSWNWFGKNDPLWAVNSLPGKRNNRWDKNAFFQTGKDEIAEVITFASSLKLSLHGQKAMDFGCGVGRLSQALSPHFDEVCGIDISPIMLELAKEFCPEELNCNFYLNQKADLSQFENDSFDFIYSSITLQHIRPETSFQYLEEFMRILKHGGLMVFQLPEQMALNYKGIILRLVPRTLAALLFRIKNRCPVAMEMHHVSRKDVENLVTGKLKGRIVGTQSAWGGHGTWYSTCYYVIKP